VLIGEIIVIALNAIRMNKLRSALTLLGVVVGVFSIIGVMTAVQVLQNSIESGLSNLGTHTFQIQKFPVLFVGGHDQWERFRRRKDITFSQGEFVKEHLTLAKYAAIEGWDNGNTVQTLSGEKTNPNVNVAGEVPDGIPANNWSIRDGRSFTDNDERYSGSVAILGPDVEKKIFPRGGAIGSEVKIRGNRYTVIGIFEAKGGSLGGSADNFCTS
jgi:putative ABC transport system permease protein